MATSIHPIAKEPICVRIGSRKSQLALIQTEMVCRELRRYYPEAEYKFDIITMSTKGDHILDKPLSKIGDKALFTKELEDALLEDRIDFVVHSLKDLPTILHPQLCIAAVLQREDPNDALVLKKDIALPDPAKIFESNFRPDFARNNAKQSPEAGYTKLGTSSLRRIAQLRAHNLALETADIRGNLTTRFRKLDDENSEYFGLILAYAGLVRAGFRDRISMRLDAPEWFHAVGQGALGIECRAEDERMLRFLSPLIDIKTTYECIAERIFMQKLEGGCSVPLGVRCRWTPDGLGNDDFRKGSDKKIRLALSGAVFSLDGQQRISATCEVDMSAVDIHKDDLDDQCRAFTSIRLPSHDAPCFHLVEPSFANSAKLGYDLAQLLKTMGVVQLLDDIRSFKSTAAADAVVVSDKPEMKATNGKEDEKDEQSCKNGNVNGNGTVQTVAHSSENGSVNGNGTTQPETIATKTMIKSAATPEDANQPTNQVISDLEKIKKDDTIEVQ